MLLPLAFFTRRPGYLFSHAFWLDEGWVADSVRAPLHQLRLLTAATPIGWSFLLRLIPHVGPPERLRALPLAFGLMSVVAAYLLGRRIGRVAALAAGLAAALAPTALRNHSLKQYSADAFVTLLLLWLTARLDAGWSRRRLVALGVACASLVLVSHATIFVSAAVLGALAVRALVERRWERLGWIAGLGLGVAAVEAAVYLTFAAAGDNAAMHRVWAGDMIPLERGLGPAAAFVGARSADAFGAIGYGPWPLAVAVVVAGLVAMWRLRLPATATAVCLLAVALVVAGVSKRYPFLDDRTSVFFTTLLTVCGALGIAWLATWIARRPATLPLGVAVAVGAGALLFPAAHAQAMQPMPANSVDRQMAYVLSHRRPGDVVVIGFAASFSFAYYYPGRPTFSPAFGGGLRFQVDYPGRPDFVVVHTGWPAAIDSGLREAAARSSSGRVWLVRAEAGDGKPAWNQAAARIGHTRRRSPWLVTVDAGAGGRR
ncbi:MAG TPA: hypothetical protein VE776_11415, partial [Actinomycetota bacterium]|nr:hypothetical protein [Actinomycetota bacterium]